MLREEQDCLEQKEGVSGEYKGGKEAGRVGIERVQKCVRLGLVKDNFFQKPRVDLGEGD